MFHVIQCKKIRYNCDLKIAHILEICIYAQWRSEGNWRPGAKLNFAPPLKKNLKTDIEMFIVFH